MRFSQRSGTRMTGEGPYAELMGQRFRLACARLGLNRDRAPLRLGLFQPPPQAGEQMALFR